MIQKTQHKEESIKKLRNHLEYLTNELSKTTEYIQLLELQEESGIKENLANSEPEHELGQLLQKQNSISREIILVKKRIQKLSAKAILKIELAVLPVVIILLFFVAANYVIQPTEVNSVIKTRYVIENLRGSSTDGYNYWNLSNQTLLIVNVENNDHVSNQKIQAAEQAILSAETVASDGSLHPNAKPELHKLFRGWQEALQTASGTKYPIPKKFNIIHSQNGDGQIVIMLSTIHSKEGYSGSTKTIADGNQILKSFITIYDSNKLTDDQIGSIVRHEFGHALGLPDTGNSEDLMHGTITTNNPYISTCDIDALEKSYNGIKPSDDFCK